MKATIDFGIDLGTTNSSVACCRNGAVRLFQTTELMTVTPSVVYVGKSGRMLVGKRAYDTWPADPENTQAEFKRWMGFSDKLTFPAAPAEHPTLLLVDGTHTLLAAQGDGSISGLWSSHPLIAELARMAVLKA